MIRQIFALSRIYFRFTNTSSFFKLQNRQILINTPYITKVLTQSSADTIQNINIVNQLSSSKKDTISTSDLRDIDKSPQNNQHHQNEQISSEQNQQDIKEVEQTVLKSPDDYLKEFKNKKSYFYAQAKFNDFQCLMKSTLQSLSNKQLKQIDLIQLFSIIRSVKIRNKNDLLLTKQIENKLKEFVTQQKNSKTIANIINNWKKYDVVQLLKLTTLYRYLPNEVIIQSLDKIFTVNQQKDVGYLKHLQIICELLQKKQKLPIMHLNDLLIQKGSIVYHMFKHHFSDFELIMRFILTYNVFAGSRVLSGLMFNHIIDLGNPLRKGYDFDYQFLKNSFSIYYTCVNLRAKIKLKHLEQMPVNVRETVKISTPSLEHLLDGFFGLSNFTNCNEYLGNMIVKSIKKASRKQIKTNINKIQQFIRYLLLNLKPQYCLNSMKKVDVNVVTGQMVNDIKDLLPIIAEDFILQFLQYEFDPFVYRLLFENEKQFQPFLDKYCFFLQSNHINPLPIVQFLNKNLININPENKKLKKALQLSWKSLNKQYHKWPICLSYYYYFTRLSKHLNFNIKEMSKFLKKIPTKIEKNLKQIQLRHKTLLPLVTSNIKSLQYLLPVFDQNNHKQLDNQILKRFIQKQVIRTMRTWTVLQYLFNFQAILKNPSKYSSQLIETFLQNLSFMTMVDNQITIIHPDVNTKIITQICQLVLTNQFNVHKIDVKSFQILCLTAQNMFDNKIRIKKLLQLLGSKEQQYIPQMIEFLEKYKIEDVQFIKQIIEIFPPTFKNPDIDRYIQLKKLDNDYDIKNSREIKKYLTIVLDDPLMRLNSQLKLSDLQAQQQKYLFLCCKLYETILKIDAESEIKQLIKQVLQMFPAQANNRVSQIIDRQQQLGQTVYSSFGISQKQTTNTKFQLLKFQNINAKQFETVELLDYPIEQQILRNISCPSYIQNNILTKLNEDINQEFQLLKPWFDRMAINAKISNNTLMLKGKQKKVWQNSINLLISKSQAFKLNIICVYILNNNPGAQFVVIEEDSNIESAIKNYIFKKYNML